MTERKTEVRPLPRRILDHGRDTVRAVERTVDRRGDPVERLLGRDLPQVAARMEVEPVESQRLAARHLLLEGAARLFERFVVGVAQIDQVTVVGQNLRRRITALVAGGAEGRDLLRRKRRSAPLPLILGKKGECRRPDGTGVAGCVLDAARSAHMCSEVFHNNSFTDKYTGFPE